MVLRAVHTSDLGVAKAQVLAGAGHAHVTKPALFLEAARVGLEADPNVKALKDMFGAELVADSVEPISSKSAARQE